MRGQMFQQPAMGKGVKGLLYACAIVFILQLSFSQFGGIAVEQYLGFAPVRFLGGMLWQIFTYPFLHGGLMHVMFNCLFLYMLGSQFETRWGTRNFLKYYFVCAVGGAFLQLIVWLFSLAFFPGMADFLGSVPVIGASGAIYGLFMAFGLIYADTYILVFFLFPMKAKHFVSLITGVAIVSAVFYSSPSEGGGVAHLVHLGGLFTGFLYLRYMGPNLTGRGGRGGGFPRFRRKRSRTREEVRQSIRVISNDDLN